MDIDRTKLGQDLKKHRPESAEKLQNILSTAENMGAHTGVQRFLLICEQYDQITPATAYQLIDMDAFQQEIEEYRLHSKWIVLVHVIRNVCSLFPLIATWVSLYLALHDYQGDMQYHPGDRNLSFLQLWQSGFHGATTWTFTSAALLDVLLLFLYLIVLVISSIIDRTVHARTLSFGKDLRKAAEIVLEEITKRSLVPITSPQDINNVTVAIRQVIDQVLMESKQLARATEQAIQTTNKRVEDLFNQQITPYFTAFQTQTTNFQAVLSQWQGEMVHLQKNIQQQNKQVESLESSMQSTLKINQGLQTQLQTLDITEQKVLTSLNDISNNVISATGQMTRATQSIDHTAQSLSGTAQQLHQTVQIASDRMLSSENNILAFQNDLGVMQNQLKSLQTAIQDFSQQSSQLGSHVHNYLSLGQSLEHHVHQIEVAENTMLPQLSSIVTTTDTVGQHIGSVTAHLQNVASSISGIAGGIDTNVQTTMSNMNTHFDRATRALNQVENQLAVTSATLAQVVQKLSTLNFQTPAIAASNSAGLLGILFSRSSARKRSRGMSAS